LVDLAYAKESPGVKAGDAGDIFNRQTFNLGKLFCRGPDVSRLLARFAQWLLKLRF
jgi:hypothetical protein